MGAWCTVGVQGGAGRLAGLVTNLGHNTQALQQHVTGPHNGVLAKQLGLPLCTHAGI